MEQTTDASLSSTTLHYRREELTPYASLVTVRKCYRQQTQLHTPSAAVYKIPSTPAATRSKTSHYIHRRQQRYTRSRALPATKSKTSHDLQTHQDPNVKSYQNNCVDRGQHVYVAKTTLRSFLEAAQQTKCYAAFWKLRSKQTMLRSYVANKNAA